MWCSHKCSACTALFCRSWTRRRTRQARHNMHKDSGHQKNNRPKGTGHASTVKVGATLCPQGFIGYFPPPVCSGGRSTGGAATHEEAAGRNDEEVKAATAEGVGDVGTGITHVFQDVVRSSLCSSCWKAFSSWCCFRFPFISSLLSCWRCRCGAHWQTASRTARVWRSSTRHRQGTLLDSRSVPEHLPESNWRSTQLRRERTRYAYVGAPHHALSRLVCPGSFYLAKFCTYFIIIDFGHPTAGLPQFMDSYDFTLASHPARASTAALTRHHLL